jgi:hypothetical protein
MFVRCKQDSFDTMIKGCCLNGLCILLLGGVIDMPLTERGLQKEKKKKKTNLKSLVTKFLFHKKTVSKRRHRASSGDTSL